MSASIVAVVAHPDDESLIAGGTLALAARGGTPTGVVCLTRGELGPIADPALATPERLGDVREAELHSAVRALGIDWAVCLRYADGELPWTDPAGAAEELAAVIAPHSPEAVLTFGDDGLYGHPDHTAAAAIAIRAAALIGDAVGVYEAAWPRGLVAELATRAAERGVAHDLWGIEPEAFGSDREPTVTIDVRPVLQRKLAALRAHRTQFGDEHLLSALPADLAERYLGEELWVGPSSGALERLVANG